PFRTEGGAPTTKPIPTPTRRSTASVRTRARPFAPRRCSYGVLQPNRIPMRIIPHRLHQPRPDRGGYDTSGQRLQVLLPAHRPIMTPPLPHTPPDPPRTNTPHPPHHSAERLVIQLHQPMEMIRHHDIAPGLNTVLQRLHTQGIDQ